MKQKRLPSKPTDDQEDEVVEYPGEHRPSALDQDILELFKHREIEPAPRKTTPPVSNRFLLVDQKLIAKFSILDRKLSFLEWYLPYVN